MGWTRIQTKKVSWCQISKKNTILHFSRCILPDSTVSKEPACQCRRHKRCGFNPCIRKIPWSRKWQPTPVFLPGKSHGQTSLEGYSPWGRKESNMTEHAHTHTFLMPIIIWWDFPRGSLVKNLPEMQECCVCAKSLQSCLTLCDPLDCSPPGSSVHGILQARLLKWVAMPSCRGSSRPRNQTHISYVSCIGRQVLYH